MDSWQHIFSILQNTRQTGLSLPRTKFCLALVPLLVQQGFCRKYEVSPTEIRLIGCLPLRIRRVSTPSSPVYTPSRRLPQEGMTLCVMSTSQGIMTASQARHLGIGGEWVCVISPR